MTPSPGFPAGVHLTQVPDPLIKSLLLEMDDLAEIKLTFYFVWLLHQKKGYPAFVTLDEMLADSNLVRGLAAPGLAGGEALRQSLSMAVSRGTILTASVSKDGERRTLFFLNNEPGRKAADMIERGRLDLGRPLPVRPATGPTEAPDIFTLYQENIGLLTPLIADELREAEKEYPASWIEEAFTEAVSLNKRSWRYISRILERWSLEGKSDGKSGRYSPKTASSRK